MRRRDLVAALGAAVASPVANKIARAQTASSIKRPLIAIIDLTESPAQHTSIDTFFAAMNSFGYVDGKTATILLRLAGGNTAALPSIAADLARLRPDVVVGDTASAIKAAETAMPDRPVVGITMTYPVEQGLIASFARPGGNLTGLAAAVDELSTKLLDLGLRAFPTARSVGLLMNPSAALSEIEHRNFEEASRVLGLAFHAAAAGTPEKIDEAMASLAAAGAQLVVAQANGMFFQERGRIGALAIKNRMAVITTQNAGQIAQTGYLLTYGVDFNDNYPRAAEFVDKILKGSKPAELPVEFPNKLVLTVNVKTAQALGLKLPEELLTLADTVIE